MLGSDGVGMGVVQGRCWRLRAGKK